jgi:hypothetical protein
MNKLLIGSGISFVVLAVVLFALPRAGAALVLEIFLFVVAVLALRSLMPALGEGPGRKRRRWWRRRQEQATLPSWLLRHQGLVVGATRDTVSADGRLLKELRGLAAERLASKHQINMSQDPGASRHLLGEAGWEILRPDWATGRGAWDPGATLEQIGAAVSAIERL